MGYVNIDRDASRKVAEQLGGQVTLQVAQRIAVKAKALADARVKRSSVADRIDITVGHREQDARVVMSVIGRDGSQIAAHLEWGYHNNRSGKWIPGKHILRDATFGG